MMVVLRDEDIVQKFKFEIIENGFLLSSDATYSKLYTTFSQVYNVLNENTTDVDEDLEFLDQKIEEMYEKVPIITSNVRYHGTILVPKTRVKQLINIVSQYGYIYK
jgi:hypothetical protein